MAQNKDESQNKDYPGYPHYPAKDDITQPGNNTGKVETDKENISLPDVSDIPGQANVVPPPLGELADTTISSADEEDLVSGDSLDNTGEDDDVNIVMGTEADVTADDLRNLGPKDQDMDMGEDEDPGNMQGLDETDDDGEPLNENSGKRMDATGEDLDVPGSEEDDANENIGEEDEENNYYSRSQNDDENTEGIP